jgi:C-terminal processing protease CtpA/Prc
VDDVITRIGGTSARYFTLDAINQLLQKKAGKKVRLSLLRGKETLRKEIILRDLI